MNVRSMITAVLIAAAALLPPALAARHLRDARAGAEAAQSLLDSAQQQAREILNLRAAEQRIAVQKRPQEHVLAQVNAVLADAGVPSRKLQGVRPEADQALAGPASGADASRFRRQSISISFQQMEVAEFGRFLANWREAGLIWIPSRIELTKHRGRAGADDLYDITLVISAVYLTDS